MKDKLTIQIFNALARCRIDSHLGNVEKPVFEVKFFMDDHSFDHVGYLIPYSRELSFFKNPLIKQLLFLIEDYIFWSKYQDCGDVNMQFNGRPKKFHYEPVSEHKDIYAANEFDCRLDLDSDFIPYNNCSLIEKSILIRIVYLLMGTNPYSERTSIDLNWIYRSAVYELDKLLLSFHHRNLRINFIRADWMDEYPFNSSIRLLQEIKSLLKQTFKVWSYSAEIKVSGAIKDSEFITKDELIQIWGGTKKAFNNEIATSKKEKNEIIKTFDPLKMLKQLTRNQRIRYESKNFKTLVSEGGVIELNSAVAWLKTKGINTKISENYDVEGSDCSYFKISKLFDMARHNFADGESDLKIFTRINKKEVKLKQNELKFLKFQLEDSNPHFKAVSGSMAERTKITVVAIGEAGRNIVSTFQKNNGLVHKYIFIDKSDNSEFQVSGKNVFNINLDMPNDEKLDYGSFRKYMPQLHALLLDSEIVCVVAVLGGYTSIYGCWLADMAMRDLDCVKFFFVQRPLNLRGRRTGRSTDDRFIAKKGTTKKEYLRKLGKQFYNADRVLKHLAVSEDANVFEFNNRLIFKQKGITDESTIEEIFNVLDSSIRHAIFSLVNVIFHPGFIGVSLADIKTVFANQSAGIILNLQSLENLDNLSYLKEHISGKPNGSLVVMSEQIVNTFDQFNEAQRIIETLNIYDETATLIYGTTSKQSNIGESLITIFLSGIDNSKISQHERRILNNDNSMAISNQDIA